MGIGRATLDEPFVITPVPPVTAKSERSPSCRLVAVEMALIYPISKLNRCSVEA